jgi:hypothetical protein
LQIFVKGLKNFPGFNIENEKTREAFYTLYFKECMSKEIYLKNYHIIFQKLKEESLK